MSDIETKLFLSDLRVSIDRKNKWHGVKQLKANGGGGGIRTHGTLSRTPVFKTGALNRSATPPGSALLREASHVCKF